MFFLEEGEEEEGGGGERRGWGFGWFCGEGGRERGEGVVGFGGIWWFWVVWGSFWCFWWFFVLLFLVFVFFWVEERGLVSFWCVLSFFLEGGCVFFLGGRRGVRGGKGRFGGFRVFFFWRRREGEGKGGFGVVWVRREGRGGGERERKGGEFGVGLGGFGWFRGGREGGRRRGGGEERGVGWVWVGLGGFVGRFSPLDCLHSVLPVVLKDSGVVAHVAVTTTLPVQDCLYNGCNLCRANFWG